MSFTRRSALALLVLASLASGGCGLVRPAKKGTLSCSCGGTGCDCSHCKGEGSGCTCTATDAYPDNKVGEPGD
ncbi:MAG: hypothetical protein ACAI25_12090 [Planctomycetota bacterium]